MRHIVYGVVMLGAMAVVTRTANAEVAGGYIDTARSRAVIVIDHSPTIQAVMGVSIGAIQINPSARTVAAAGQSYLVYPDGHWRVVSNYADRYGVQIGASVSRNNKMIYVDTAGRVRGGVGLTLDEVRFVARSFSLSDVDDLSVLVSSTGQQSLYNNVAAAAGSVRNATALSDVDRSNTYVSAVGNLGGSLQRSLADDVQWAAYFGNSSVVSDLHRFIFGTEILSSSVSIFTGVGDVSYGDNGGSGGGKGLVAYGDNGGSGGGKGLVAYGDNGGSGGGKGIVLIPTPAGLSASCAGNLLYVGVLP